MNSVMNRKPVKRGQDRCYMFMPAGTSQEASSSNELKTCTKPSAHSNIKCIAVSPASELI